MGGGERREESRLAGEGGESLSEVADVGQRSVADAGVAVFWVVKGHLWSWRRY